MTKIKIINKYNAMYFGGQNKCLLSCVTGNEKICTINTLKFNGIKNKNTKNKTKKLLKIKV